jgi:5-(carboxyamino)imidazole ribonucleotide synthase
VSAVDAPVRSRRVGILGGGQLARMTHQAAIALGVELTVLADGADGSAARAGARVAPGTPADPDAVRALAEASDVVTFDHERVPLDVLEALIAAGHAVHPVPAAKALAQDKLHARRTLDALGFPVPAFAAAESAGDVARFAAGAGWPVVVKARRGGYDGRGVHVVAEPARAASALDASGGTAVVEEHVAIAAELAVLVARRPSGEAVAYPVVETVQEDGMCREMRLPARVPGPVAARARALGLELAEAVGATGVLAVELFATASGALLVNELALRPHNSGHWTIEGATTSQFEQHLRAVLDLPLGATDALAPAVATVNVVGRGDGDPADRLSAALAVPGAHVHLYGKAPRDGRKLGHVTALGAEAAAALETARTAAARLEGA